MAYPYEGFHSAIGVTLANSHMRARNANPYEGLKDSRGVRV